MRSVVSSFQIFLKNIFSVLVCAGACVCVEVSASVYSCLCVCVGYVRTTVVACVC